MRGRPPRRSRDHRTAARHAGSTSAPRPDGRASTVIAPGPTARVAAWHRGATRRELVGGRRRQRALRGTDSPAAPARCAAARHAEDLPRLGGFLHDAESPHRVATCGACRAPLSPSHAVARPRPPRRMLAAASSSSFGRSCARRYSSRSLPPGIVYMADAVGTQTETLVIRGPVGRRADPSVVGREALAASRCSPRRAGLPSRRLAVWDDPASPPRCDCRHAGGVDHRRGDRPAGCSLLGRDPAFGSGPLATVIQDLLSIVIYLVIASAIIPEPAAPGAPHFSTSTAMNAVVDTDRDGHELDRLEPPHVENASWRTGTYTIASWAPTTPTAHSIHWLVRQGRTNALWRSDRTAIACPNWRNASVVNTIVRRTGQPASRDRQEGERHRGHQQADPEHVLPEPSRRAPTPPGRVADIASRQVPPARRQRHRGQPVGHEVDPQDLDRRQRQRPADAGRREDEQTSPALWRAGSGRTSGCCRRSSRPSSTASTIVAKLSSVSTMSAASLVTSVPVIPMAMPMSAALTAGRVVDAVARHRDHVAAGLPRVDDLQLVLGVVRAKMRTPPIRSASASASSAAISCPVTRRPRRRRARHAVRSPSRPGWSPVIITR